MHAEFADPPDERVVLGADRGQLDALGRDLPGQPELVGQQLGHRVRADLVELVDPLQHRCGVLDTEPAVEALRQLAVVDVHARRRQAEAGVQLLQGLQHHQRRLDVMVVGQGVLADDVDVSLGELTVTALLGALPPPDLLNLVAAERELQVSGVLQHVAGQRHGQVEVQPEIIAGLAGLGVQPPDDIDLLGDLALAGERVHRLHGAGLDTGESVQLEGLADDVDDCLLDHALGGQKFRKAGQRLGSGHQARASLDR